MKQNPNKIIDLSVVIPTKNREKDLLECLDSLFKQDYLPKEVIIVDQSDKEAKEKIKSVIPNDIELVYIFDKNITGATQARNRALDCTKGTKVLLLDDDIIFLDDSLKNLLDIFKNDINLEIGGIGGHAINEIPSLFHFIGVRLFCHGPFSFWNDQITFDWKARKNDNLLLESKIIPAGASCVRAEVFKKFRFDENLVGYTHGDDSIFGYQASSRYRLFLYSGFKYYHKKLSKVLENKAKHIERQIIWWFYFYKKYVKKTIFNKICYAWSIVGIVLKVLIHFYDLDLLRGAFSGLRSVITDRPSPGFSPRVVKGCERSQDFSG